MKIYHSIEDFVKLDTAVVTSGMFDGCHVGHKQILNRVKEIAEKHKGETVVITFWPHPRLVLYPDDNSLKVLNTFEEKADLLKEQGIQHLLRLSFTKEFSQLSSQQFITDVLVNKIGTRKLVIGYDHRFGKNREGSFEQLKLNGPAYGFDVEEIPKQEIDNMAVSSSKIREALLKGNVETATHLLGKPYSLSGRVIKGDQIGRTLGFPTANIDIDSHYKLIPGEGIYAVTVEHENKTYGGMLYIGTRPVVQGTKLVIEVNIFDFNKEIYGETIQVNLIATIRKDMPFRDLDAMKMQLELDKVLTLKVLSEHHLL